MRVSRGGSGHRCLEERPSVSAGWVGGWGAEGRVLGRAGGCYKWILSTPPHWAYPSLINIFSPRACSRGGRLWCPPPQAVRVSVVAGF